MVRSRMFLRLQLSGERFATKTPRSRDTDKQCEDKCEDIEGCALGPRLVRLDCDVTPLRFGHRSTNLRG